MCSGCFVRCGADAVDGCEGEPECGEAEVAVVSRECAGGEGADVAGEARVDVAGVLEGVDEVGEGAVGGVDSHGGAFNDGTRE